MIHFVHHFVHFFIFVIDLIGVEPACTFSFVYNYMQKRLKGQFNTK